MELEHTILTLFFTKKFGLKIWSDLGVIDRELAIYKKLSNYLKKINMVTYGGSKDKKYSNKLGDIKPLSVKWHNSKMITLLHLLIKHYPDIKNSDIFKTNQILGSDIALWFKKKFRKKLLVRCGYLYSQYRFIQTENVSERRKAYNFDLLWFNLIFC